MRVCMCTLACVCEGGGERERASDSQCPGSGAETDWRYVVLTQQKLVPCSRLNMQEEGPLHINTNTGK